MKRLKNTVPDLGDPLTPLEVQPVCAPISPLSVQRLHIMSTLFFRPRVERYIASLQQEKNDRYGVSQLALLVLRCRCRYGIIY